MDYLSLEHHYQEIPARKQERRCTDTVCTTISIVFALGIFTYALIAFIINIKNPSPYLNIDQNLAVSERDANITLNDFTGFCWTLIWTGVTCVSLGLLWLTIVQNLPQYAPTIACLLATGSLLVVTFFSIFDLNSLFKGYQGVRWTMAGLSIFVTVLILIYMFGYKKQLVFQGLTLKMSARFYQQRYLNFFDLLIWIIFTLGFVAVIMFQQLSFSYHGRTNNDLYDFGNPGFWGVINIIEYIWGISFLKDSFIFVLSGNAIDWYWKQGSIYPNENTLGWTNLFKNNWGSVALGSFLNAFLKVPCLILEILICHPRGLCGGLGKCCEKNFIYFLLYLIRTDSYAFINLFGRGYCDSGLECLKLFDNISYLRGKQSPQRNYRIISTIFLVTLSSTLSYIVLKNNVSTINFWFVIVLFFHVYTLTEYFSSFHASAAEGIQTSILIEMIKQGGYTFMQRCYASVRRQLQYLQELNISKS